MLAQRNQEIAELTAAAVTAELIPDAALTDLPVAQLLSPRRDDSTRPAIEADINNRPVRGRQRSIISRMLPYRSREPVDDAPPSGPSLPTRAPAVNGWEQRSLPNGDRFWWNTRTHVATWQLPRNIRSRMRIVPVDGSGSGTRNMKKKNKKKSKKKKGKGRR